MFVLFPKILKLFTKFWTFFEVLNFLQNFELFFAKFWTFRKSSYFLLKFWIFCENFWRIENLRFFAKCFELFAKNQINLQKSRDFWKKYKNIYLFSNPMFNYFVPYVLCQNYYENGNIPYFVPYFYYTVQLVNDLYM